MTSDKFYSKAIQNSRGGNELINLPQPLPVGAEWIGRQLEQSHGVLGASMTEEERYSTSYSETSNEIVIVYVHGGGNFYASLEHTLSTLIPPGMLIVGEITNCTALQAVGRRQQSALGSPKNAAFRSNINWHLVTLSQPPFSMI